MKNFSSPFQIEDTPGIPSLGAGLRPPNVAKSNSISFRVYSKAITEYKSVKQLNFS